MAVSPLLGGIAKWAFGDNNPDAVAGELNQEVKRNLDERGRAAVTECVTANPKGRFGTHGYRLEDYGLAADEIRERFADYIARYDVSPEAGRA